jgi:hypothetical protein
VVALFAWVGRATLIVEYQNYEISAHALPESMGGVPHFAVRTLGCGQSARENPHLVAILSYYFSETGIATADWDLGNCENHWRSMAMNFVRTSHGSDDSIHFQPIDRLKIYLFGVAVLFASFGMGEAVYRLLFSEFDGARDRIPIELLFGLVFACLTIKFVGGLYRNRKERSARLDFIWARNHHIRGALDGITPLAHPSKNQQSIRVIREEVDSIERALKEILPR